MSKGQGPQDRLGGRPVEPSAPSPVAFGLLEDLFPSLVGLRPTLGSRHSSTLLLASLCARGEVTRPSPGPGSPTRGRRLGRRTPAVYPPGRLMSISSSHRES